MKRALKWQRYVSGYTLRFGLPLSYISYAIYREQAIAMLFYSITVRVFISVVPLSPAIAGHPPFLYVMAAIVGIGVGGSTVSCVAEKRHFVA